MKRIFVYGTLKRGYSNHHFMAGQRFLGEAETEPGYTLYTIEDYPGMIAAPDASGVTGEVWEVSDEALALIDQLEGLEEGLYTRDPILLIGETWRDQSIETYLFRRPVRPSAHLGRMWKEEEENEGLED